jgi:hypothetical protein
MICLGGRDLSEFTSKPLLYSFAQVCQAKSGFFVKNPLENVVFSPSRGVFFNRFYRHTHPILRADLPTCNLRSISNGIVFYINQRCAKIMHCQPFDRDGLRPSANGMDTRTPKGLVGGEWNHNIWDPRMKTGSCCTSATMMDNCFATREQPIMRNIIHHQNIFRLLNR